MWETLLISKTNWFDFSIEKLSKNYLIIFQWNENSYELEASLSDNQDEDTFIVDLVLDEDIKSQLDEEHTYWFWESLEDAFQNLGENISPIIWAFEDEWVLEDIKKFLEWCIREEDPKDDLSDLIDMESEVVQDILDIENLDDDWTDFIDEDTLDLFEEPEEF